MGTRDVILAKGTKKELKLTAGHEVHFMFGALHHDPRQWGTRHNKYIPERFDPQSEHFKAPNGNNRHPYSYAPFLGGHRICLGKTFAETVAKKVLVLLMKLYELEHEDPEMKVKTHGYDLY